VALKNAQALLDPSAVALPWPARAGGIAFLSKNCHAAIARH
jgi:hypothetical protein